MKKVIFTAFMLLVAALLFSLIIILYKPYMNYKSYSINGNTPIPDIVFLTPSHTQTYSSTDVTPLPSQFPYSGNLSYLNTATLYDDTKTPALADVSNKVIELATVPLDDSQLKSSKSLTVIMEDEKNLGIYSSFSGNKLLITKFIKKDWGTWNIGGWYVASDKTIPSKKHYLLVGGSSDWEYVFRVAKTHDSLYEFSGGNHDNEYLKSFKLYDNESGCEIPLKQGQSVDVSSLGIVEETYLTLGGTPSNRYADVKREYTVTPSKILLSTYFDFTSDVYMGTSYVCMMPSNKSFGRYIKFIDSGNIYETPQSGATLTTKDFENFIGKEKTMSVEIWGDSNPSYRFVAGIQSEEMTDYFKNDLKVFYWDLNSQANKLYFSKYNNEDYELVKSGTKWSHSAYWEFILIE